jgi:hypothetical protein
MHVSALDAAVVIRPPEARIPQADLKTTNNLARKKASAGFQEDISK